MIDPAQVQPQDPGFDINDPRIVDEIVQKRLEFESRMGLFLKEFAEYANAYRMMAMRLYLDRAQPNTLNPAMANLATSHTTRAVETIATMQYAMMTSASPNFDVIARTPYTDDSQLFAIAKILEFQKEKVEFNRKLLKGLRSLALFGTVFYETPWISSSGYDGKPVWEATDFNPLSVNQVGFAPNTFDLAHADWRYTLNFLGPGRLRMLADSDPTGSIWNKEKIEDALASAKDLAKIPIEIRTRLIDSGYSPANFKDTLDLNMYYGPLESLNIKETMIVGLLNNTTVIRAHPLSVGFNSGIIPFLSAQYIEFELEPYGYGIGKLAQKLQREINANRNRVTNIILFSLFNMWKMSKYAGIRPQQLKIRPWHVVKLEDMNGLEPIRPAIEAVNYGLKLEDILTQDFETVTAATKNLQATVNESTTFGEARLVQAEAVRRVGVMTEIIADRLIRNYLYIAHKNNLQNLDRDIWFRASGEEKPIRISPSYIQHEVDFSLALSNDKNFRPKRQQDLTQLLQILTSLRNFVPPEVQAVVPSIVMDLVKSYGIDMRNIKPMAPPQNDQMMAQRLAQVQALGGFLNKENDIAQNGTGYGTQPNYQPSMG